MCLILQGTRVQIQVLKPCKSFQESSEEVLCFKAQQISSTAVSIENYENQFFRTIFHACTSYAFRFSSLTTLDIYKDYFKSLHKVVALLVVSIL